MKRIGLVTIFCLGTLAMAQDIRFDYDRSADFDAYRTYQWARSIAGGATNQLMDQNIQRAVDEQMAAKGMQRVENGGDVQLRYQVAVDEEKQFDGFGSGPRWSGMGRVTSSTIEVGKMRVDVFDPARNQLVWTGVVEKPLDLKKDPDKNYRNLQKAMAKLFKNYPPQSGKG
jgi:hypothetical protein